MFENIVNFFKKLVKPDKKETGSRDAAKERLHLVLMQDRANVSADFLELMKQEIIEVIKKYIEIDEKEIDVRLTNQENEDGTNGAPALYANIPILNIKNEMKKEVMSAERKELDAKIEEVQKIEEAKEIINEVNNQEQNDDNVVKFEVVNNEAENVAENYTESDNTIVDDNAFESIPQEYVANTGDTIIDNQEETETQTQQFDNYNNDNDVQVSAQEITYENVEGNNIQSV